MPGETTPGGELIGPERVEPGGLDAGFDAALDLIGAGIRDAA